MKLKMELEYSDKSSCFELELLKFFSKASRKFFIGVGDMFWVPVLGM